jgi:hypothetical protein
VLLPVLLLGNVEVGAALDCVLGAGVVLLLGGALGAPVEPPLGAPVEPPLGAPVEPPLGAGDAAVGENDGDAVGDPVGAALGCAVSGGGVGASESGGKRVAPAMLDAAKLRLIELPLLWKLAPLSSVRRRPRPKLAREPPVYGTRPEACLDVMVYSATRGRVGFALGSSPSTTCAPVMRPGCDAMPNAR